VVKATLPKVSPGKELRETVVQDVGWVPGSVRTVTEKLAPTGIRFPDQPYQKTTIWLLDIMTVSVSSMDTGYQDKLIDFKRIGIIRSGCRQ